MFEDLVSRQVADLVPYPPGKPQEEVERELGISGAVKIASNENPYGPSPKARDAVIKAAAGLHRYPDGSGYYLKEALARKLGAAMTNIVLGNGSNEIIELAVRTFLHPGRKAIFSDPTFLMYSKVVQGGGGRYDRVPLKDFGHDLTGLAAAVDDAVSLVFLDNPNNPTGTLVPAADLKAFMLDLPRRCVLVVDEAYVDFVRNGVTPDPLEFIETGRPVIFMRTFSKAYGLAGLRIGYGLAHPELAGYLDRVRQPFNVSSTAQAGARAALDDEDFYRRTKQGAWDAIDFIKSEMDKLGLKHYPTETNFLMIDLGRDASEAADRMLGRGVIIRSLKSYGLPTFIRVNAGADEDNRRFVEALAAVLRQDA